jgi:hypothetical protein
LYLITLLYLSRKTRKKFSKKRFAVGKSPKQDGGASAAADVPVMADVSVRTDEERPEDGATAEDGRPTAADPGSAATDRQDIIHDECIP